jgi:hypothetical protein
MDGYPKAYLTNDPTVHGCRVENQQLKGSLSPSERRCSGMLFFVEKVD